MRSGWVYAAEGDGRPGFLKIGQTRDDPERRVKRLKYQVAGGPFRLVFKQSVADCVVVERLLHYALRQYWELPGREFFRVDVETVAREVQTIMARRGDKGGMYVRKFKRTMPPRGKRPPPDPRDLAAWDAAEKAAIAKVRIPQFHRFLHDRYEEIRAANPSGAELVGWFVGQHDPSDPPDRYPSMNLALAEWRRVCAEKEWESIP